MVVVILSVCPERLRGVLTRWLLEISTGVYVGHVPARVRDHLWSRIIEDASRGRALMVHSTTGEQRLTFRTHRHAWKPVDIDGLTLMRRQTAESRALRVAAARTGATNGKSTLDDSEEWTQNDGTRRNWSNAARHRRFKNAVERRHEEGRTSGTGRE